MNKINYRKITNLKLPLLLIRVIVMRGKRLWILFKNKLLGKHVIVGKKVRFNQKTIFSGRGAIILENNVSVGYKLGGYYHGQVTEFQARYADSKILIKNGTAFNNSNCLISGGSIEIGQRCRIGANVLMMDYEAHGTHPSKRDSLGEIGKIVIGDNVWIGTNVTILKNVTVGNDCIIAAGSVVLKGNYPPSTIIGGNPAKVIKRIDD